MKIYQAIGTLGATIAASIMSSNAADVNVTSNITSDTVWTSNNVYILKKPIFVKNDAKLTIEPGTTIYGAVDDQGTPVDTTDDTFGSLVVTRGAKIFAEGTCSKPIVFTSIAERDGVGGVEGVDPNPEFDRGLWGGLILLGKAPINYYQGGVNIGENDIEGFPTGSSNDIQYGGSDEHDSSGVLKYVSIRFGGYEFAEDEEINGLTLGGVGDGTCIEHVEVIGNSDDGVEFFGGTVNTRYMAVAFCKDESFDMDEGHQGTHQFWFTIQGGWQDGGDNGTEADGGNGSTKTGTPLTTAKVYNATYIGAGASSVKGAGNDAFRLKDNFAGQFHNSVFHDFDGDAMRIDDANTAARVGVELLFQNNTWGTFNAGADHGANAAELTLLAQTGNSAVGTNPLLRGISRTSNNGLDPRPAANSPLWSIPQAAGTTDLNGAANTTTLSAVAAGDQNILTNTVYRGAFGLENWLDGWSYLSKKDYLATSGPSATALPSLATRTQVNIASDITGTTVWTAGNVYVLNKPIFVKSDATLLIEPGAYVLGDIDKMGTPADSSDDTFGSLVVTRGSKLVAQGVCDKPIVFTSIAERDGVGGVEGVDPNPEFDRGLWGGLILLGKAPINYYQGGVNVGENDIEGFPAGSSSDIEYGGSDANDYSGNLRFLSIRFGGYEFAEDEEINGLTLGGVGKGTGIEHVEVVGNSDDGVEFFGGTVNTKHMVVAFCKDESFDLDEGHQGCHQFWFTIQAGWQDGGDNGTEADGGNGSTKTGTPLTTAKVYNATYIGAGAGSVKGSGNDAFRLKDNFAGQFHNSIFHDFDGDAMRIDDTDTAARVGVELLFQNNIWGTFNAGPDHGSNAAELVLLAQTGNTAVGTNPNLRGISRSASSALDPRPFLGSPAFTNSVTAVAASDEGCFCPVEFRGAFGMANWAEGWTYLSEKSYFGNISAVVETADYITWRGVTLSGEVSSVSPFEDFNADGTINFVSYAFDMDPQSIADRGNLPKLTNATTGEVTYTRRKVSLTGLTYNVFLSTDLNFGSTPAVEGVGNDYTQVVTSIDADTEQVVITPASIGTKIYIKVEAE